MKLMSIFFVFAIASNGLASSKTARLIGALDNSDWGAEEESVKRDDGPKFESQENKKETVCTKSDQTSIPDQLFLRLLQNKSIKVTHDPNSGQADFDAGLMIGNCNEMLSFDVAKPSGDLPYLFQVNVKESSNCEDGKCKYTVYTAEDGIANEETLELELEPSYYGFMECLEKTGVFNKGKIEKSKIFSRPLSRTLSGAYETAPVWFSSHGPESQVMGGMYSDNLKKGKGCYYFSELQETPLKFYSKEDVDKNQKLELYKKVCSYKDYSAIDAQIGNFEGYEELQRNLIEIRNKQLENRLKALHTALQANDLSNMNPETFKRTTQDFIKYIVNPLIKEMDTNYNLYQQATGEDKRILEVKLDLLSAKLMSYVKAPYINSSDYERMKDFRFNSPIKDAAWREALYNIYQTSNAAFHYGKSYNKDFRTAKNGSFVSPVKIRQALRSDLAAEKKYIDQIGILANNPNRSFAQEYMGTFASLKRQIQQEYKELAYLKQIGPARYIAETCSYVRKNQYSYQACAKDTYENYQDDLRDGVQRIESMAVSAKQMQENANKWQKIEATIPGRENKSFSFNPEKPTDPKSREYIPSRDGRVVDPRDLEAMRYAQLQQRDPRLAERQRFQDPTQRPEYADRDYERMMMERGLRPSNNNRFDRRYRSPGNYSRETSYRREYAFGDNRAPYYRDQAPWQRSAMYSNTDPGGQFSFNPNF